MNKHQRHIKERAKKAKRILNMFYDKEDHASGVIDCIADMLHYCKEAGVTVQEAVESAKAHYYAETEAGQEGGERG